MKVVFPILLLASLTACGVPSTRPAPRLPALPQLTAAQRAPCPPLPELADNSIATLSRADTDAALNYARCQAKHGAAIAAYDAVYSLLLKFAAEVRASQR